jgi:pimeloyl-ACP methyl ester carboxylesterase
VRPVADVGVVLLHGLRGSSTLWRHQVDALTRAGHVTRVPDFPAHGSRRADRFTLDTAMEAVEDAASEVTRRGGRVLLVGQSLGGYIGLHWAARTRQPLAGVIAAACSTVPSGPKVGGYRLVAGAIALLPDRGAWLNQRMAAWTLPEVGAQDAAAGGYALDVMQDALRAVRRVRPLEDIRALGRLPLWIVNGAFDHFRFHERAYLRAAANGRLIVVPRVKHLVSLEAPVTFTRIVLDMLDEVGEPLSPARKEELAQAARPARPGRPAGLATATAGSRRAPHR